MKKPTVHVSHDFQTLRKQLTTQLFFAPSKPFQKKLVFLPDLKEKNNLLLHFLDKVNIIMGIEFMQLGSGLQFLYQELTGKTLQFPPLDLLTLHILSFIEKTPELRFYKDKKAQSLAAAISKEFLRYGKFGYAQLNDWKTKKGWQQTLWNKVFSHWNVPSQLLETPFKKPDEPIEVHLYKFSFLPEVTNRFFEKVASYCTVHYYQFSPCCVFWTDILSEKERFKAEKKADPKVRDEWATYLRDRPLLLANLGRLSRQTFRFFEEAEFSLDESYPTSSKKTLLSRIQNDILHFQIPSKQNLKTDQSLILHPASSKRREVEILYSTLLSLMNKHHYRLSDIRIYAPDISLYAPFISFIFGAESSPFAYSISDLPKEQESSLLQTFFQFLSLTKKRFERTFVLKLFSCPAFRKRFSLNEQEVAVFAEWMEKGGVKWGVDKAHRKTLLSGKEMHEETTAGTWENAFEHILLHFAKIPEKRPIWETPILDFSAAETVGKGISIIRALKKDLMFLEAASFSLSNWSKHLHLLLNRYFQVSENEASTLSWIEEKLTLLESPNLPTSLFPFQPIFRYLQSAFQEKSGKKVASQMEALHFSTLKLAALDHAAAICLLGLDENQFPRLTIKNSLSELEIKKEPTSQEEDRHLFLEALFAPSSHLIMSYVNISEEDGKKQAPSPLVQELFTYLDSVYTLDQKKPSTIISKNPPPFLFHASYFQEKQYGPQLPYYVAKQFYSPKTAPAPFIPEFLTPRPPPQFGTEDLFIDLKHLSRFAKNPLRFYLNHALNIYLQYEKKDEEFTLSPLNQALLHHQAQTTSFDEAFQEADQHGKLPLGRFKDIARQTTSDTIQVLKDNLKKLSITAEKLSSIDFTLNIPLKEKRFAHLAGTLSNSTTEGLLFHGEKKLPDLLKIWPLFLTFACLNSPGKKHLLLIQTGERLTFPSLDPQKALASYLLYYEKALTTPSPCMPNWAASFLEKDPNHLAKKIAAATDPYVQWIFRPDHFSPETLFKTWSPLLKDTFKPLRQELA